MLIIVTEHTDPGSRADPAKPHLLNANTTTKNISPYIGTEVSGVQISELTKEGLDELALFTAERKVVIFRDQDFKDLTPERQIEIASYVCQSFAASASANDESQVTLAPFNGTRRREM